MDEETELEEVNIIASGYDWTCPNCDYDNHIIEIPDNLVVTCNICKTNFKVDKHYDAFEQYNMKEPLQVGYKVVRKTVTGLYLSVCEAPTSVEYRLNTICRPDIPKTPLFIFTNLDRARSFAVNFSITSNYQIAILNILYKPMEVFNKHLRLCTADLNKRNINGYWKNAQLVNTASDTLRLRGGFLYLVDVPDNTSFAEFVIPLQEVSLFK